MSALFDQLQHILVSGNSKHAHRRLRDSQTMEHLEPEERARVQMLLRLSHAAERFGDSDATQRTGTADLMVLIRQVIRVYGQTLDIPSDWWQLIQHNAGSAGLYSGTLSDTAVTVHAERWTPDWLPNSDYEDIGGLEYRRTVQESLGDGMVSAFYEGRVSTYRSEGQKAAVDAVLHATAGASLLVTLPTGGGKSLCFLLPAWLASGGGRRQGGTTIVVVPTVSLALDQRSHVMSMFPNSVGPTYRPSALLGDTKLDVRAEIYQGIQDGTLPILYTSPESLLNNRNLQEVVLRAAENGSLNWLVIDEAHMVEQWGAGFRTEFQLLAAFRRQLLTRSNGQLRTLLLSATISEQCKTTLTGLFGDGEELATVMSNQLRPEVSYWQHVADSQEQRQAQILEALFHLPRPAIVYVTRPIDAEDWIVYLREHGFERLAAYTGKTAALERSQIMREWARNERDLIVATSAFGLGVDKEDVRTVIHATLPENVDRFYQEVGRGGRDGCRSVSLLCTALDEDFPLARSMSLRSRITVAKAWPRWDAMWSKSEPIAGHGNHFLLDLEAAPIYNPEMKATDTHRNWNEHILLLMQRAGAIDILDANPTRDDSPTINDIGFQRRWLHIMLNNNTITYSKAEFEAVFEPQRKQESRNLRATLEQMHELVVTYASDRQGPAGRHCLGQKFTRVFPHTAYACGGCSDCRSRDYAPNAASVIVESEFELPRDEGVPDSLATAVGSQFSSQVHQHVFWNSKEYPLNTLGALLPMLLNAGFVQFILPTDLLQLQGWVDSLLDDLRHVRLMPTHRLLSDAMVLGKTANLWSLQPWPTVVVYPIDSSTSDSLYRSVVAACAGMPMVQVLHRHLYLPSEHGHFMDKVDGRNVALDQFTNQMERLETL